MKIDFETTKSDFRCQDNWCLHIFHTS